MEKKLKIVYCTPSLYIAGGVERVLTTKANYLAEQTDKYDVTIILTDGNGRQPFYKLSEHVKLVNLDLGFEELWNKSFVKKVFLYLSKQRRYRRMLRAELMRLRPDITVSTLRREINFLCTIPDGSKKVGEMHINRLNYRNFEAPDSNAVKRIFAKFWSDGLLKNVKKLDRLVVLTEQDRQMWTELDNVTVIPNPLPVLPEKQSTLEEKRVIAVGRYTYQKGFDLLLQAWSKVEKRCPEWRLAVFGAGDREPYLQQMGKLGIDDGRCELHGAVSDINSEYLASSVFVLSSRNEGFGMVLLEGMAHGLAAVSFECPCGPRDIVDNGKDGILVENGNVDKLAEAIIHVIEDDALRHQMAKAAAEKARQYDISAVGKRWEKLFAELCASR